MAHAPCVALSQCFCSTRRFTLVANVILYAPELNVDEGAAVSYNFLHLTVQEYLAAFHLSLQPVEKQIEHFREYKEVKGQWKTEDQQLYNMVLQFLCGLRKFSGYPSGVPNTCVEKHDPDLASVVHKITFDALHWLFEVQDNDVIAELLGSSDIQLHEHSSKVTPFDCFVDD